MPTTWHSVAGRLGATDSHLGSNSFYYDGGVAQVRCRVGKANQSRASSTAVLSFRMAGLPQAKQKRYMLAHVHPGIPFIRQAFFVLASIALGTSVVAQAPGSEKFEALLKQGFEL